MKYKQGAAGRLLREMETFNLENELSVQGKEQINSAISYFSNNKKKMSIMEQVKKYSWYHAINLGNGVVTEGRFAPKVPPNFTLFPVYYFLENISTNGMNCIDIGTTDGIVAFILKQEGAESVVATDRGYRPAFEFVRETLNLDVKYLPKTTLDKYEIYNKLVERNLPKKYDLVVMSGVVYHSYDPLMVLMHSRSLLKANGLIIIETAFCKGKESVLYFNPEAPQPVPEPNTYFLPTISCLNAMLKFCCCNPIAFIVNGSRLGAIARACIPSKIFDKSETLEMIIERSACYGPIDYKEIESDNSVGSTIEYLGGSGTWSINMRDFKTRFPLQPVFEQCP